jgi:hypothetical protein
VFCVLCFVFCVLCFAAPKYFLSSQFNGGRQADRQFIEKSKNAILLKNPTPKNNNQFLLKQELLFFSADNCVARKQFRYLSFDCQIRVSSKALPFPTTLIELSQSIRKMAIKTEKTI